MTIEEVEKMIRWKKQEFNRNGWNAMDLCLKDILNGSDVQDVAEGMKRNMLEGDNVIAGDIENPDKSLTVRYYCDNLSDSRRRMY